MRKILIIGAGKSSSYLIKYLLDKSKSENLKVTIGDLNIENAKKLAGNHDNVSVIHLDVFNTESRTKAIKNANIVVSMLPARFHIEVAKDCISYKKHMVTASYVSKEMQALNQDAKTNNLVFMNEIGVDPGIDHMSAMQVIDSIRENGGKMILFESFTGGLVSPESDDNLWNYKFTWNPTNVVLAGQGGSSIWKEEGEVMQLDGHFIFANAREITVPGIGVFDVYANRNSLTYEKLYGLTKARTLLRGTLRRRYFCAAWDVLVLQGFTDSKNVLFDEIDLGNAEDSDAATRVNETDKSPMITADMWFFKVTGCLNTDLWIESLLSSGVDLVNIEGHLRFLQLE